MNLKLKSKKSFATNQSNGKDGKLRGHLKAFAAALDEHLQYSKFGEVNIQNSI